VDSEHVGLIKMAGKIKRINILAVVVVLIMGWSCGKGEKIYILKTAHSQNPNEPQVRAARLFKKIVEQKSAGRVRVEIYPNNQLGNQRDVIEGIQLGTIQMSNVSSVMAGFVKEVNIFELPFLFKDREHLYKVLDSGVGESLRPAFKKRGFHLLGYFYAGVRHIMTVDNPVENMADLRGLKIRTMENPLHLDAFQAFGANPLPMAYGELYSSLEQHVIDGAEAANTNYYAKKFFEPAPFWAQVGWIHLVEYVIMSRYFYERLPQEMQVLIDVAAREMIEQERRWYYEAEQEALAHLIEAGVTLTFPDRFPFIDASQKVYLQWADRVGGLELIERIVQ